MAVYKKNILHIYTAKVVTLVEESVLQRHHDLINAVFYPPNESMFMSIHLHGPSMHWSTFHLKV